MIRSSRESHVRAAQVRTDGLAGSAQADAATQVDLENILGERCAWQAFARFHAQERVLQSQAAAADIRFHRVSLC
jgi:hypothetical protein